MTTAPSFQTRPSSDFHIEKKYGFDFDRGLSPVEKGDGLGARADVRRAPLLADPRRPLARRREFSRRSHLQDFPTSLRRRPGPWSSAYVRGVMRKTLRLQGLGRHDAASKLELARRDFFAISDILADKPFLFGDEPRGADASVGAFVIAALAKATVAPLRDAAESSAQSRRLWRTHVAALLS